MIVTWRRSPVVQGLSLWLSLASRLFENRKDAFPGRRSQGAEWGMGMTLGWVSTNRFLWGRR